MYVCIYVYVCVCVCVCVYIYIHTHTHDARDAVDTWNSRNIAWVLLI